jgi:hypothetical protein
MNPAIQLKQTTSVFLVAFALACFALSPAAKAVSPPPDGGYAGFNTAEGQNALLGLTTGQGNTGIGWSSLSAGATNNLNTAVGAGTLVLNTADNNTALGAIALLLNTTGNSNTATGASTLTNNVDGSSNTANGFNALHANTHGTGNTAIGRGALANTVTGANNTALGDQAGNNLTTNDSGNIDIGSGVQGTAGESNTIRIGANLPETAGASACHIGGIFNQTIDPATGIVVGIDTNGKLGTILSSRRFKHDIKSMGKASEAILALNPVTFHYASDAKNTPCFGLVAEEVAEINPNLVVRDKNNEVLTVRYDAVNAMLLNEFLKEHRTVQEQGATIARQQKQIEALTTGLQKVSAQLELNKPGPQTVVDTQ